MKKINPRYYDVNQRLWYSWNNSDFLEHNLLNLLILHFILQMIETLGYIHATIGKNAK